jgi:hypothetical protein
MLLLLLNNYTNIDGGAMINSKHLQFSREPYGAQTMHKNIKPNGNMFKTEWIKRKNDIFLLNTKYHGKLFGTIYLLNYIKNTYYTIHNA